MSYRYEDHRSFVLTDEGQRRFLVIRDTANRLHALAGCVRVDKLMRECSGSSWDTMACIERLVELGEFSWDTPDGVTAWQYRILRKANEG